MEGVKIGQYMHLGDGVPTCGRHVRLCGPRSHMCRMAMLQKIHNNLSVYV